ncbi:Sensor histidine kinase YesM [Lachnospiraceae bacterium NLAE-zl-G231]|nr:Sensor histidine kinase YesM [Lachnospiraceae bacterium NLAE-zl-G231]
MEEKTKLFGYKNSVTVKSLALMIILSTAILLGMELISFYYMSVYEKSTMENYRNSLEMYCSYWDNKLDIINNSLLTVTSSSSSDSSYSNVCNSRDELVFQTAKKLLVNRMSDIAWNHENEVLVFVYVPDREVFLKSTNHLVSYDKRLEMDQDIKKYASGIRSYNSTKWDYFKSGTEDFFIQVYRIDGGYIGALVKCQTILDGVVQDNGMVSGIGLTDDEGKITYSLRGEAGGEEKKDTAVLLIPMTHIDGQLKVEAQRQNLFGDKTTFTFLSLITVSLGLLLLAWNVRYQVKAVLGPLNKLRSVMEKFSRGNLDVRLEEKNTNSEIDVLNHTFNEMAEQIVDLKIDVYEAELAREKTESNYMRVQIQPHFYTNILNLIYGLAQLKDFASIQKLSMTTGAYFRYLLGEKGTFVLLREEIQCVKNYIQIQQIRYKDEMEFELYAEEGMERQMVLPMILQTFAENSVKHNIGLVPLLRIRIDISSGNDRIYITVRDNGAGFEPDMLERINKNENISNKGEHIGITNVKERLRIFYGDTASVEINSRPGETLVKVVLPEILTQEERNEYHIGG